MGKIVVADELEVRKIVKEEIMNFYDRTLKNEFYKLFTKISDMNERFNKFGKAF